MNGMGLGWVSLGGVGRIVHLMGLITKTKSCENGLILSHIYFYFNIFGPPGTLISCLYMVVLLLSPNKISRFTFIGTAKRRS